TVRQVLHSVKMAQLIVAFILGALALVSVVHASELHDDVFVKFMVFHPRGDRSRATDIIKSAPVCSTAFENVTLGVDTIMSFGSYGYPERYSADLYCGWNYITESGYLLDLFCPFVSIQHNDYFDLHDVDHGTYNYVQNVDSAAVYYYFWGSHAKIALATDASGEAKGFQCYIWAVQLTTL
uniref:hypothetical protein n=1 Tax=Cysteiniphilum litorale TaxID=2056700 RepID=UPI003F88496C